MNLRAEHSSEQPTGHVGEEPDLSEAQRAAQLAALLGEITRLFQRDYILLATFLRALTR